MQRMDSDTVSKVPVSKRKKLDAIMVKSPPLDGTYHVGLAEDESESLENVSRVFVVLFLTCILAFFLCIIMIYLHPQIALCYMWHVINLAYLFIIYIGQF